MNTKVPNVVRIFLVSLFIPTLALAQDVNPPEEQVEPPKKEYSPFVGDHFPTKTFFGDTHVHTA